MTDHQQTIQATAEGVLHAYVSTPPCNDHVLEDREQLAAAFQAAAHLLPVANRKIPSADPQASPADRASGPPGHIRVSDLLALARAFTT